MNFVAATLDLHELRIRDSARKGLTVCPWENRIGRAMKDEKRHFHLLEPALPCLADLKEDATWVTFISHASLTRMV